MRQRKIKNLDEKLAELSSYIVEDPAANRGAWREVLGAQELYLEIGCGKGQFINRHAALRPEAGFVAVEGNESVAFHAVEKAAQGEGKLCFILDYVKDLGEFFQTEELDGLYLNFSDPWPKARHEKRRLTTKARLLTYAKALKPGGVLEFKTDNDGLFEYTLTQVAEQNVFDTDFMTRDLHRDVPEESIVTTEYEDKFSNLGKNINFIRLIRK